jgi:hypothetical protein
VLNFVLRWLFVAGLVSKFDMSEFDVAAAAGLQNLSNRGSTARPELLLLKFGVWCRGVLLAELRF